LTDEQKEKVTKLAEENRERMRGLRGGGQPDPEKLQAAQKEANEAAEKLVKDTLKPEQQKRLHQISLQARGLQAFTDEKVAKELNLTDEQKDKIKTLAEAYQNHLRELRQQGGGGGNAQEGLRAARREYTTKARDVLTAEQKEKWNQLTGEPFDYQPTF